ncbi:vWA domain-containing protein [Microbulbifer epialgicus]|uniref:VWFA domain-containing protein n=1 Tax=Microbulbifer epialgicus TaxID=393907 RepID=A0ABV4NU84_9GAMM
MKRKSREISIFSTSLVDIFASTSGAFLLIMIVLLPFFPNTGDSSEKVEILKRELETTKEKLTHIENTLGITQKHLQAAKDIIQFPPFDLVIALDTTGSMRHQVDGLRKEIDGISELFQKLSPSAAISIIDFKDHCEPDGAINIFPLTVLSTRTLNSLKGFVSKMHAGGSGCNSDGPEALYDALVSGVRSPFRPEAKFFSIVIITDNLAHPAEQERTLATGAEFHSRGSNHFVSVVDISDEGHPFLKQLASQGGGEYINSGSSMTLSLLRALTGT